MAQPIWVIPNFELVQIKRGRAVAHPYSKDECCREGITNRVSADRAKHKIWDDSYIQ